MRGFTINARWPAISARRSRRISSSLLPLNIGPQTTSSQPPRSGNNRITAAGYSGGRTDSLERPAGEEPQADDPERPPVLHDGQVAEVVLEHDLRGLLDRDIGRDRDRVRRHPLPDAGLCRASACGDGAHQVALGDDADDPHDVLDDDDCADIRGVHLLRRLADRVRRLDGEHVLDHQIGDGVHGSSLSLPKQARKPPILEDAAAGLAFGAVEDRVLLEVDLGDRRAADVARLAELLVHAVGPSRRRRRLRGARARGRARRSSRSRGARPLRPRGRPSARTGESFAAWRISFAHARPMPAIDALVAEERVEPARLAAHDLAELRGVEAERFGAEMLELRVRLLRGEQPDARALALRVLRQDELASRRRTRARTPASSARSRRRAAT